MSISRAKGLSTGTLHIYPILSLTHFPFMTAVFQFIFIIETIARYGWLMQGRKCSFFMYVRVQCSYCGNTGESMGYGKIT